MLELSRIRIDGNTQSRVEINQDLVAEYAEAYRNGAQFPAVVVFYDGADYWLADGFHRYWAATAAGHTTIYEAVTPGLQRDAILFSLKANATHGLQRSNADKRKSIQTMLNDPEWEKWSDREIARACAVSSPTVGHVRSLTIKIYSEESSLTVKIYSERPSSVQNGAEEPPQRTYTTKHGTVAAMNVANIGRSPAASPVAAGSSADASAHSEDAAVDAAPSLPAVAKDYSLSVAPETHPVDEQQQAGLPDVHEQISELQASLKQTHADNEMMGRVFDADDKIKAAMDEARRQKAIAENAERKFNAQQGKVTALAQAVEHWKRRAEKAEKALAKLAVPT